MSAQVMNAARFHRGVPMPSGLGSSTWMSQPCPVQSGAGRSNPCARIHARWALNGLGGTPLNGSAYPTSSIEIGFALACGCELFDPSTVAGVALGGLDAESGAAT